MVLSLREFVITVFSLFFVVIPMRLADTLGLVYETKLVATWLSRNYASPSQGSDSIKRYWRLSTGWHHSARWSLYNNSDFARGGNLESSTDTEPSKVCFSGLYATARLIIKRQFGMTFFSKKNIWAPYLCVLCSIFMIFHMETKPSKPE